MGTHHQRRSIQLVLGGGAILVLLLFTIIAGSLYRATAQPQAVPHWFHSPVIARHIYSVGILPCTATTPGQLFFGRDIFIFSVYPPPGWSIPTAPACP